MPWPRPTLTDLQNQTAGDITTNLAGADGLLRRSNLRVVGKILAGLANLHFGYEDWIAQQAVPFTSTDEFQQGWAALKGVVQKPAAAASGAAQVVGSVANTDIPVGTLLLRGDGRTYATTVDVVVGLDGTAFLQAQDQTPGAEGNMDVGTKLTLAEALPGVQSNLLVTTQFTGGADVEDPDNFRTRMLQRYAQPPQGGSTDDYITWALQIPGVTRAWVNRNGAGPGTVVVYTMWDVSESAHGGFPQGTNGVASGEYRDVAATGDQLTVANYIYAANRQPVTALVYSVSPVVDPKSFTISNLNPNTTDIKTAIAAAIADVFLRQGSPGGTILMADVNAAIDAVPGIIDFIIQSPTTDIISATGHLPVVGTITYI